MRQLLVCLFSMISLLAAHAESKSYTINDMFTISVDSKLELRDMDGLYVKKTRERNLPVNSDNVIVFQQAGLNNDKSAAYQKYARIMIQTENGNDGDYAYCDRFQELSDSDMVFFNRLAYQELTPQMRMTIKPSTKGRFLKNGYYCIMTSYQRSGVYGNVDVSIYYFFNNSQFAKILYSYKNSEKEYWQKAMDDAINSFRWIKVNGKSGGGNDEAIDTIGNVPTNEDVSDTNKKPINSALTTVVLTVVAIFVFVWLLNTNKITVKEKWIVACSVVGVCGLVILWVLRQNDIYLRNNPPNDPELELAVKRENERLPLQIAEGIVLKEIELKDSAVVSTIEIDETKYPFEDFLRNKDLKKRLMMTNIATGTALESYSYVDLANLGYSVKKVFKGLQSHREIIIAVTPEEIKNVSNKSLDSKERLDLFLNTFKQGLPNKVDDGLTLSNAEIKDKLFIMIYTVDEDVYDMKELVKYKNDFTCNLEKDLKTEGWWICLASLLAPLEMSLRVSYVGAMSKKKIDVDIPATYLKEVVSDNRLINQSK